MKKVFAVCAFALSAFCVSAQADTLKVGSHPTFAPFEFVDSEGKAIGFDIDLINAIAKANGDTVEIVSMPFDGLIPALVTNQIDAIISGMTITDVRKERVEFTNGYYKSIQSVLIRKADADKFKKVEDLKGQKICTQIGTTGDKFARTLTEDVIAMNNEPDALMELRNGGCSALINDRPTNLYYLLQSKATEIGELKDDSLYLEFETILDRHDFINAIFLSQDAHQIFGKFNGYLKLENKTYNFKDLLGFSEKVKNKW